MAALVRSSANTPSTPVFPDSCRLGDPLPVGEDIAQGDACYIKSDGKIWRSNGAAGQTTAAEVDGWAPVGAKVAQRQTLSLVSNVNMPFVYTASPTVGTYVYLSETVLGGVQAPVATSAQAKPIARVIKVDGTTTILRVLRTY
jgi:hypothetical protein